MAEFKDMLKYYRQMSGLSQAELAEEIGVRPSTISMYEVGKRQPDFETEEALADFFNIDLNTLRGRDTETVLPKAKQEILDLYDKVPDNQKEIVKKFLKSLAES